MKIQQNQLLWKNLDFKCRLIQLLHRSPVNRISTTWSILLTPKGHSFSAGQAHNCTFNNIKYRSNWVWVKGPKTSNLRLSCSRRWSCSYPGHNLSFFLLFHGIKFFFLLPEMLYFFLKAYSFNWSKVCSKVSYWIERCGYFGSQSTTLTWLAFTGRSCVLRKIFEV